MASRKPPAPPEYDLHCRIPADLGVYLKARATKGGRKIVSELTRILQDAKRREPSEAA